jgi:hypothetical protein
MCSDPTTHGKILRIDKQSDWLTYHRCVGCDEIISWWEKDRSKKMTYSEEELKKYI